MNIPQFKRWLEQKIEYVQTFPDEARNPDDRIQIKGFINEAYQHAVALRLPEAAAACRKGPATIRLIECLNVIPQPTDKGIYSLEEAAERLGVSRRTVSRLIDNGELECTRIGRRVTITAKQLGDYQELKSEASESLFG